ncbi:molecular chaperone Tir [Jiangella aurantiaca]|uniref:Molecular chaperone Tir n=1 Tax=Jiangella aurantiaca TaxID=2530373 RepID=A0A4R5A7F7_9ACTN|nr:TIR domain-containing protein [Jiangella aurantiaca]TDD65542.1 molecular chaperone Tir [Jiangella aurantiaca]
MAYRNKLYIAFDGDNDMRWYRLLTAWEANKNIDFDFHNAHDLHPARDTSLPDSIKAQLRKRMQSSKTFLLLVGERTKYIRGYIPWEIEYARHLDLPIVVTNLNDKRRYDSDLCPSSIPSGKGAVHVSYEAQILKHALDNWPIYYASNRQKVLDGVWHYDDEIYKSVGLG